MANRNIEKVKAPGAGAMNRKINPTEHMFKKKMKQLL
jgi:hypothetical protein